MKKHRLLRLHVVVTLFGFLLCGCDVHAQAEELLPAIPDGPATLTSLTAAEAKHHLEVAALQTGYAVGFRRDHYPEDSMRQVATQNAARWLTEVRKQAVQGLQFDPSGNIGVSANAEAYAISQFESRLETPGLSAADRAFTLYTAVEAFSDTQFPQRLGTAEQYLNTLDAMGADAAYWRMRGHAVLLNTYYDLGRRSEVVRHGTAVLSLVSVMSYIDRGMVFANTIIHMKLFEALAGQPDGRAKIDSLSKMLRAHTKAPRELFDADTSSLVWREERYKWFVEHHIRCGALLGAQGKPLIANYWVNRATTDSAVIPVNDGKIRVVEIGTMSCPGCLTALQTLRRLKSKYEPIEVSFHTFTYGNWGNRLVTPDEEAQHLSDYFTNVAKVQFPIGVWKRPKSLNGDDGISPEEGYLGGMFANYPLIDKPTMYILDGRGIIRRMVIGGGREEERHLGASIEFLLKEQQATSAQMSTGTLRVEHTAVVQ
jgi:hypothetical protein